MWFLPLGFVFEDYVKLMCKQVKFYLRDCILCKGQILHKNIKAFIFFIQKLSDPSGEEK